MKSIVQSRPLKYATMGERIRFKLKNAVPIAKSPIAVRAEVKRVIDIFLCLKPYKTWFASETINNTFASVIITSCQSINYLSFIYLKNYVVFKTTLFRNF